MKAMRLFQFAPIEENPLRLEDVPAPRPRSREILVQINICGVCHTDLHTIEGELQGVDLPLIPGHQIIGRVAALGPLASRFKIGERVGLAWLYSSCGTCCFCCSEQENLCENARFTGYNAAGGYAEFIVIHEKFGYRIPEVFKDEEASPLLCAGIIGFRALRISDIQPGQRLGLIGFGASAHVAIQIARFWDCEVYVFSRSSTHQEHARSLGAVWTGTSAESPPEKLDAVINFTPAGNTVPAAMEHLDKGGTQALAGIYMSPIPEMDYTRHLYFEKKLRSVANATRQDGEDLLKIAADIPIRTTTRTFPLDQANQALLAVKHSRIDGAAVLTINS